MASREKKSHDQELDPGLSEQLDQKQTLYQRIALPHEFIKRVGLHAHFQGFKAMHSYSEKGFFPRVG